MLKDLPPGINRVGTINEKQQRRMQRAEIHPQADIASAYAISQGTCFVRTGSYVANQISGVNRF